MKKESKGMILGFLGVSCFGLTLPATRFIIPFFEPLFIGLGRAVIASIAAAIFLIITRPKIPTSKQFFQLIGVASGIVIGFPVLSAWALQTVPASHGGVVLGIMPLATAIVGAIVYNEKPSLSLRAILNPFSIFSANSSSTSRVIGNGHSFPSDNLIFSITDS